MKTLKQMKGSEIHRIVAAVLEVMEKVLVEPQVDATLQEAGTAENGQEKWKMVFQKKDTSMEELNNIKTELGSNFSIQILPRDKACLQMVISAEADNFAALLQKRAAPSQQKTMFDEKTS